MPDGSAQVQLEDPAPAARRVLLGMAPLGDAEALNRVLAHDPARGPLLVRSRGDDADALTDMTARDPRGVGVRGGYPQINRGEADKKSLLRFVRDAYARSAAARVIVDRVAADTWGSWIQLQATDALKARLDQVFKFPTSKPGDRPIWWWFERADKLASRDGRALLFFNLADSTGDARQKPRNVRGIRGIQLIRQAQIQDKVYDTNPDSPTFNEVIAWRIWVAVGKGPIVGVTQEIHADRVLTFIPDPDEDDPYEGISLIVPLINYVEWAENLGWASAEAYFQEAQPLLAIYRDPEIPLDNDGKTAIKDAVGKLQQNALQRVFLHGAKIEVVNGTGQLADPTPHWALATDCLAMAMGYPKRWLFGDAAGELAASKEDTRRAETRLQQRREQYAGPILYSYIARLLEWGVQSWPLPPAPAFEFSWNPNSQPDAKEEALRQMHLSIARGLYQSKNLPLPEELQYEPVPWPEGREAPPAGFGGGFDAEGVPAAEARRRAEGLDQPDAPFEVQRRFEARLEAVLAKAKRAVARLLATKPKDGQARGDALDRDAERTLLDLRMDQELARIIADHLEEAAYEGAVGAFRDLGQDRVFDFIDDTRIRRFKTLGRELGASVQERLAEYVRRELAEGLTEKEGTKELTQRLEHAFSLGRVDAQRIARTETNRGYNVGTIEALRALGVNQVQFVAFPDADNGDPNGPCQVRSGRVFNVAVLLEEDRPPIHPNCRCQLVAFGEGRADVALYGVTLGNQVQLRLRMVPRTGVAS